VEAGVFWVPSPAVKTKRRSLCLQGRRAGEDARDREELPGSYQRRVDGGGHPGRPESQTQAGGAAAAASAARQPGTPRRGRADDLRLGSPGQYLV